MNAERVGLLLTTAALLWAVACSGSGNAPTAPTSGAVLGQNPTTPPVEGVTPGANPTPNPTTPTTPPTSPPPPPTAPPFSATGQTARVLAVGDIAMCTERVSVERTAALVNRTPGALLLAGDLAYMTGSLQDFRDCFDPSWGRFRTRWKPVPGNHEYETPGAAGYRQYFGDASGAIGRTYYSFREGDWLIIMIDSTENGRRGSAQYEFVRTALQGMRAPCTMAVWHHPLFSSGPNGPNNFMRDLWGLLYDSNADVIVSGHDHLYERFGKQDVDGRSDVRGLRQFIVGTGGATLYDFQRQEPNSQARIKAHGVLQLTLAPNGYHWAFLDVNGATLDSGTDGCH